MFRTVLLGVLLTACYIVRLYPEAFPRKEVTAPVVAPCTVQVAALNRTLQELLDAQRRTTDQITRINTVQTPQTDARPPPKEPKGRPTSPKSRPANKVSKTKLDTSPLGATYQVLQEDDTPVYGGHRVFQRLQTTNEAASSEAGIKAAPTPDGRRHRRLEELADRRGVSVVCGIGFNGGYPAAAWLSANPKVVVHIYDACDHPATEDGVEVLEEVFPKRFHMHCGDTALALRTDVGSAKGQCDAVWIDDQRDGLAPLVLLVYAGGWLVKPAKGSGGAVVIMNQLQCGVEWCEDAQKAWGAMAQAEYLRTTRLVQAVDVDKGRRSGWAEGRFPNPYDPKKAWAHFETIIQP